MGGGRLGRGMSAVEARQGLDRWRRGNAWRVEGLLLTKGGDQWAGPRLVGGDGKRLERANIGATLVLRARSSTARHRITYLRDVHVHLSGHAKTKCLQEADRGKKGLE
jgi:hypothetical protein